MIECKTKCPLWCMSAGHITFFIGQCPMSDSYFDPCGVFRIAYEPVTFTKLSSWNHGQYTVQITWRPSEKY